MRLARKEKKATENEKLSSIFFFWSLSSKDLNS